MRRLVRLLLLLILAYPALVLVLGAAYLAVPPISTLMLSRWLGGEAASRTFVPLGRIASTLPAAAIASEDARFCLHGGIDWGALNEVIEEADEGGPSRGASTIPMQVAKNLFLWPGRSVIRKAMEIPIAMYLDLIWPKRRMIEVYLNIAEWGEGVFGAEEAARRHFGKPAASLSRREAALLVTALPSPLRRNPARPTGRQSSQANTILARIADTPLQCLR
ncbi:biosynthetic peptidoglycan transglycosylase [Enterovirga sp.]|jgi:monofunctional biosynthetic peptidoglycan transglycosylase|uniref:biosynthetic peptidoglycan transglycosylase n=1 Tax=Enterovirga sp. TaxID=2026350 RepID=UPI0026349A77|nr:biosynthetic peptidoglycan transglycosylase [Enterovirga sp.]MDB5589865.1 monofunctional biosynthetic peptidoglycan transglycosylase [Enterovirga sp.]